MSGPPSGRLLTDPSDVDALISSWSTNQHDEENPPPTSPSRPSQGCFTATVAAPRSRPSMIPVLESGKQEGVPSPVITSIVTQHDQVNMAPMLTTSPHILAGAAGSLNREQPLTGAPTRSMDKSDSMDESIQSQNVPTAFVSRVSQSLVSLPPSANTNLRRVSQTHGRRGSVGGQSKVSKAEGTRMPVWLARPPSVATISRRDIIDSENKRFENERGWNSRPLLSLEVGSQREVVSTPYRRDCNGQIIPLAIQSPLIRRNESFFRDRRSVLQAAISERTSYDIQLNNEVGVLGGAWRGLVRRLVLLALNDVNALQLSRALQFQLPFQTGFEAYLTSQVIEALDRGDPAEVADVLSIAFLNRNVSRVIIQNLGPRYDFLWHWSTAITWNRVFDAWGQFPIVGITGFPATENFPSTRNHALASIFRNLLGQGNWVTRVVTQGREGLLTDNPNNTAQNLAPESNGFELANRNQYGTYFGRAKTNEFRFAHRLPTDESIVRTFVASPMPTMTNNGVVHVLRQLAKHWHNMLSQEWGNFAHQRMEQLDPFETLRFHMPRVLLLLSSLRGRNAWDAQVLGPIVRRLQALKPDVNTSAAWNLCKEMQKDVVETVAGGVSSISDSLWSWLEAIRKSLGLLELQAGEVLNIVTPVELGIRLGHDIVTQVSWKVPSDNILIRAILSHIQGQDTGAVDKWRIQSALQKTTPRDMRTLIELVKGDLGHLKPAQLLLGRVKTLLQRELRREYLNQAIRDLSVGPSIQGELVRDEWYWLNENDCLALHIYIGNVPDRELHQFIHVESGNDKIISLNKAHLMPRAYIPVAESISRAQKAFMTIELEYGKTFQYSAFMEFSFLRIALQRLVVVSQMNCEELDNARLNVLREIQRSNQPFLGPEDLTPGNTYYKYNQSTARYTPFLCEEKTSETIQFDRTKVVRAPPQSVLVVGGGPTGLITTIHCTEACLASGGTMKLQEARDAFAKGGSTFERAQIVRLDARWIAMLRYHLGTIFEDVYIPASGETDAQLGNTLPTQGFVEITIKDLESSLHTEASRLWSRGIIYVQTDSKSKYDSVSNSMVKQGHHLKDGDVVLRSVDPDGKDSSGLYSWKVAKLLYTPPLGIDDLKLGEEYAVWVHQDQKVRPFKLVGMDLDAKSYKFRPHAKEMSSLNVNATNLPSIYPIGTDTKAHVGVQDIRFQCQEKRRTGEFFQQTVPMASIEDTMFTLDLGHTHVVEAIGKQYPSATHIGVTTKEPYGVCCMQGLKVSMGMHNFGEKRWGTGILDDVRSQNDQNTRVVGDFTKMVRVVPIVQRMYETISNDDDWRIHFDNLVKESGFPELEEVQSIFPQLVTGCKWLSQTSGSFRRKTLQTRFFETGDNYYLGMEFPREYESWKKELSDRLVEPLASNPEYVSKSRAIDRLRSTFVHHIDRLWYEGCLETIRTGDVYNPGARKRVPRLYLINSYTARSLSSLPIGESFRLVAEPQAKYEVLTKSVTQVIVRSVEGYISKFQNNTKVLREGNLTRGPDGNQESKVSLATFDVGHYVNHRTMRLSNEEKGFIFAFVGDEQATPHFMRYSGLTGACINAMSFNNFIADASRGISFDARLQQYSKETDWSNGEVVQRGTGANYGQDGFLRPGFSYRDGVDYLYAKIVEFEETGQDLDNLLSRDWMVKLTASVIPRGLENNQIFLGSLQQHWNAAVSDKLEAKIESDIPADGTGARTVDAVRTSRSVLTEKDVVLTEYCELLLGHLQVDEATKKVLATQHFPRARRLCAILSQLTEFAANAYLNNERVSSELFNQPKPVDSLIDDFSVEAQNFANSLTQSAALASGVLAFRLIGSSLGNLFSALFAGLNIVISFGTMANVSRYKIRNEESRVLFADKNFSRVQCCVFALMSQDDQDSTPLAKNPFLNLLEQRAKAFRESLTYYGYSKPTEFDIAYEQLKSRASDISEIQKFQVLLVSKLIVDTYHVNSYVQEKLVDVLRVLDEMNFLLESRSSKSGNDAKQLFDRLLAYDHMLEDSLQRGPVRFGFIKQRKFWHWNIIVAFRYLYSLLCCSSRHYSTTFTPIQTETRGIVKSLHFLSKEHDSKVLRRESRDFETFFWATRESDIASLIFLSGFFVFVASVLFSVARIFDIDSLEDVAFWANAVSTIGAVLAAVHLLRKLVILIGLWTILCSKTSRTDGKDRVNISRIRNVTMTQILLTLTRLVTTLAASVALPWSVIENAFPDASSLSSDIPVWIALGAVSMAILATVFFFLVEYVVRYNLSPQLGPFVSELFRDEIESIHQDLSVRQNEIDTKIVQDRENWEYVAREFLHKYRFDTVFAADRFGTILQYIQSGMKQPADSK